MNKPNEISKKESITANVLTDGAVTLFAAWIGTPLASLLPVLTKAVAHERHEKRVKDSIMEINKILEEHEEQIKTLTDGQYKIINEIILAVFQTTEDEKINYLKTAIQTNLSEEIVPLNFASQISRILRDISVDELKFLIKNKEYSKIIFDEPQILSSDLSIKTDSDESIILSGLIALGLIVPTAATFDDVGSYRFSPLVEKLLKVIGV